MADDVVVLPLRVRALCRGPGDSLLVRLDVYDDAIFGNGRRVVDGLEEGVVDRGRLPVLLGASSDGTGLFRGGVLGGRVEIQRLDACFSQVASPLVHHVLLGLELAVRTDVEAAAAGCQVR